MGLGLTPDDMVFTLHELETIPDMDYVWELREAVFDAPADDRFHIGFHAATPSPDNALAAYIDDVKVEKVGLSGIDAVDATATSSPFVA